MSIQPDLLPARIIFGVNWWANFETEYIRIKRVSEIIQFRNIQISDLAPFLNQYRKCESIFSHILVYLFSNNFKSKRYSKIILFSWTENGIAIPLQKDADNDRSWNCYRNLA